MDITCVHCGAFNRGGAKFCAACGKPLPATPPSSQPPTALQPLQPAAVQPQLPPPRPPMPSPQRGPLSPVPGPRLPRSGLFGTTPVVDGKVTVVDPERQERAPFDPARAMVMMALIALLVALFLGFAAAGMAIGIVLLILGVGIGLLGCLAGLILMPLKVILAPIINFIRGDPTVMVLNFQVLDNASGRPVDVLLYRKPGSGNVRVGDSVLVYGAVRRGSNVVRAYCVQITESGGRPTNYRIDGLKPWPIWIGLAVWAIVLLIGLYALGVIGR